MIIIRIQEISDSDWRKKARNHVIGPISDHMIGSDIPTEYKRDCNYLMKDLKEYIYI